MGSHRALNTNPPSSSRWSRSTTASVPGGNERDPVDPSFRYAMARYARWTSGVSNLSSTIPTMDSIRADSSYPGGSRQRSLRTGRVRPLRVLHRRDLHDREKGGFGVGKPERGKGSKLMAVADRTGLPLDVHVTSASPHEVTLVHDTLKERILRSNPSRLIGDLAYDSDKLDAQLAKQRIEMIAPHRSNRTKPPSQDGRPLRRYRRRWKIERLFACLQNFRRILVRHDRYLDNFLSLVHLGCILIFLRGYF